MNDLLQLAVNAHGGIDRWNKLTWVDTDLSMTGAIWSVTGKPDVFRQVHLTAKLHTRTHDGQRRVGPRASQRAQRQAPGSRNRHRRSA